MWQLEHKNNLYQETTNIPLIVKLPNSTKKEFIKECVSLIDVMPTILQMASINVPEHIIGESVFRNSNAYRILIRTARLLMFWRPDRKLWSRWPRNPSPPRDPD